MPFPILPIQKVQLHNGDLPPLSDLWLWLNFDGNFADSSPNGFVFTEIFTGTGCDTDFGITVDRDSNPQSAMRISNICSPTNTTYLRSELIQNEFSGGLTFSSWFKKISNVPNVDCVFTTSKDSSAHFSIFPYYAFGAIGFKSKIVAGGVDFPLADLDFGYHHFFVTIDSLKVLNLWIDKVKVLSNVSITNHVYSTQLMIGNRTTSPFNGTIDHVLLYDTDHPEYLDTLYDFV